MVTNNRGLLHEQVGALDKAVADFSRSIALNANNQAALHSRAHIYTKRDQWQKAAADYSRLIGLVKDPTQARQLYLARAQAYVQAGRYRDALADDQRLLERFPANAEVHNHLAWLLATCPDAKLRDATRAMQLAREALRLGEQVGMVWNTLGVAQYRAGESKAAIKSLEKSITLRDGGDAFDWFFLAMAHERLGHKDQARTWYGQAAAWMDEKQPKNDELRRFRTEAAELLGIQK